jgi:hypothetical protein
MLFPTICLLSSPQKTKGNKQKDREMPQSRKKAKTFQPLTKLNEL